MNLAVRRNLLPGAARRLMFLRLLRRCAPLGMLAGAAWLGRHIGRL